MLAEVLTASPFVAHSLFQPSAITCGSPALIENAVSNCGLIEVVKNIFQHIYISVGVEVCLFVCLSFLSCVVAQLSWAHLNRQEHKQTRFFCGFFEPDAHVLKPFKGDALTRDIYPDVRTCGPDGSHLELIFPLSLFKQMGWFFAHFEVGVGL